MARGEHTLRGAGPSSVELTHQPPWKLSYLICQNGFKVLLLLSLCYLLMIRPPNRPWVWNVLPLPRPLSVPSERHLPALSFCFQPRPFICLGFYFWNK